MSLKNQLKEKVNFSDTDKTIADYILAHKDEILSMSIQKLAQETFTSTSAVIRLCERIHLSGYKELKVKLSQELQSSVPESELLDPNFPFHADSSTSEIASSLKKLTDQSLDEARRMLSVADLNKAADILAHAKQKALFGIGDAYLAGLSFQARMMRLGIYFLATPVYGEQIHQADTLAKEDAALLLSYSGKSTSTVYAAKILKKNGCKTVCITGDPTSPLAHLCDVVLLIPAKEKKFHRISSFFSQACMDYFLNILYSRIYVLNYREFQEKHY